MKAARRRNPATLFVVGSYHIGKERAYLGAAAQLGWKVWCPAAKRRVGQPKSLVAEQQSEADAMRAL